MLKMKAFANNRKGVIRMKNTSGPKDSPGLHEIFGTQRRLIRYWLSWNHLRNCEIVGKRLLAVESTLLRGL